MTPTHPGDTVYYIPCTFSWERGLEIFKPKRVIVSKIIGRRIWVTDPNVNATAMSGEFYRKQVDVVENGYKSTRSSTSADYASFVWGVVHLTFPSSLVVAEFAWKKSCETYQVEMGTKFYETSAGAEKAFNTFQKAREKVRARYRIPT